MLGSGEQIIHTFVTGLTGVTDSESLSQEEAGRLLTDECYPECTWSEHAKNGIFSLLCLYILSP